MSDVFWAALGGSLGVGLLALIVEALRWFFNSPLLKCSLAMGRSFVGDPQKFRDDVIFEAINTRSKPIGIRGYGLQYKDKYSVSITANLHARDTIEGEDYFYDSIPLETLFDILRNRACQPKDIYRVWFKAKSGKQFSTKVDKQFIDHLQKKFNDNS